MRLSPVWILLFATLFVSSLRLRAEPVISEERNGVEMLVELLHELPKDVSTFKRSKDKVFALWSGFKNHIGRPRLPSPDLIKPKATQEATMHTFYEFIHSDKNRLKTWTAYKALHGGKIAELVPVFRPTHMVSNRKAISDDMAKRILPTLWDEFKRSSAPLTESYNVLNFYHLSLELQEEIKPHFLEFIYADRKRARMFEGLLTWLKRNDYGKRLLAQEIEAQKPIELIKQQLWNEFRQEKDLSGYDEPTFDHLDEVSKEHLKQDYLDFIAEDPRRKEMFEQLAKRSKQGTPETHYDLGSHRGRN